MARYKFNVGVMSIEGDDLEGDAERVTGYLTGRIVYLKDWMAGRQLRPKQVEEQGATRIEELRRKLQRMRIPARPLQVRVAGTFFPATLLYSGWWERIQNNGADTAQWRDDLQSWLFTGFEQWGPSWDFSIDGSGDDAGYFFGQLGHGDEANSLPVIVPPERAGPVREALNDGRRAFEADVTGFLIHRRHLHDQITDDALRRKLARWGKAFDYCLLISGDQPNHALEPLRSPPDMYSGYLWECWMPREWMRTHEVPGVGTVIETPSLRDIYFLWEHTDFTRPDAVAYNRDSLRHKRRFLEQKHGDMILLQKSSQQEAGDSPVLSSDVFYRHLFG